MKELDQTNFINQIDPSGMLECVENFEQQCRHGEQIARNYLIHRNSGIQSIVICGMGGSAIGGDLIRSYMSQAANVPVEIVRNYSLPNYVGPETLVIASSYSGNTEETLSCFMQAKERNALRFAITTGGQLQQVCKDENILHIEIPGGLSPRAALGYSFLPLLVSLEKMGIIPDQKNAVQTSYATLQKCKQLYSAITPTEFNPAKQLAKKLHGHIPVIYVGQDAFQPIGARWQAQINENAKHFAHHFVVPEMNHNEILGWSHPNEILQNFHAVMLMDEDYHPQTKKRFQICKELIEPHTKGVDVIHSFGDTLLARMFSLISLGDYTSVYLAYLNKQDPVPIPAIDHLKKALTA